MRSGDMIGAYRIDKVGATAFSAYHATTGASVRLRLISPSGDPAAFVQAARRLCGVQAPAIHGLFDVGLDGRRCYLVDGPLPGEALEAHIARLGPLRGDAGLAFAESLFGALLELHGRDIRDGALTPERLRVVDGRAVITEPGLGRMLPALTPDPRFAAPGATDVPSVADDVYAAAAIACFAFNGRSLPADEAAIATDAAKPIVELLASCLSDDPADRPESAELPRRTIEAVRAGTLSGTPVEDTVAASAWFTDGSVDADTAQDFDYSQVPDELPNAQSAALGAPQPPIAAPAERTVPTSADTPARSPERPRPAVTPRSAPPARRGNPAAFAVLGLLLVGGAGAFFYLRSQRAAQVEPVADAAIAAPATMAAPSTTAAPPTSTASAASTAPATIDRYAHVTVQVQPAPARFVQIDSKTVLCEEAAVCEVPIDVDTRVEKDGYEPTILSGDDLYDRRGHRWRVRLYEQGKKKR